jgi:hypothetical protein
MKYKIIPTIILITTILIQCNKEIVRVNNLKQINSEMSTGIINCDLTCVSLGLQIEYLEDKDNKLIIEDIISNNHFLKSTQKVPYWDNTVLSLWIKISLKNECDKFNKYYLEVANPTLERIDLFIPERDRDRAFILKRAGTMYPFQFRDIKHNNFIFSLSIPTGIMTTYYMRIETKGNIVLPIVLWNIDKFNTTNGL